MAEPFPGVVNAAIGESVGDDASGDHFVDHEKEAQAWLPRD